MSKAVMALTFVVCLNVTLFLIQASMDDTANRFNDGKTNKFFNYDGSMISKYDAGNYTLNENITGQLPSGESSVSPETGNLFTDTFTTFKGWFLDVPGMKYLVGIINAVPNMIKGFGWPQEFTYAIGFLWHSITLFIVILLWLGKD